MKFKDDIVAARYGDINPLLKTIMEDADDFSQKKYGIELTITATVSTISEDKQLGRVSSTHRDRRAVDVRTRDLPESLIAELCAYLRKKYNKYGAVSGNAPQLVVYKPHGTGSHLHIQLNRNYTLPYLDYKGVNNA